jgi:hypothetical protein
LFQFVQSGDFAAQQERAQGIRAEGEGAHNVITPMTGIPQIGTITNHCSLYHLRSFSGRPYYQHAGYIVIFWTLCRQR